MRRRPFSALLSLAFFVAVAGSGCDGCGGAAPAPGAREASVALAAVPAPTGLLAEAVLPTPDATWRTIQGTVGGVLALTAPTFSGLIGATAGAPGLSGLVESDSPAYVVVGEGEGVHYAVAFRANEAAAKSWAGADAGTFTRSATDEEHLTIFEPVRPDGPWVGVAPGNFVVVASSRADLVRLGPYAFRTLPSRPLPKEPALVHVTHDGASRLAALVAGRWTDAKTDLLAKDDEQRKAHGGRAPDHGDPRALVGAVDRWIGAWLDAARNVSGGDVTIEPIEGADRSLAFEVLLTPEDAGPAKALVTGIHAGELRALEGAPDGALFALDVRSDAAERTATAADLAKTAEDVFRLSAADRDALAADLGAWADARSDEVVLGFTGTPSRAVFLRAPVKDEAVAQKAFDRLVRRADSASLHDLWRAALDVNNVHSATVSAAGVGSGTLVTLDRKTEPKLGLFYTAQRGELVATGAEDAPAAAAALLGGGKRLGDDPRVHDALGRIRGRAALVAVARPLLASAAPRSDAAILAAGRDGDRAMLRLEATGALLRELLRRLQAAGP